MSLRQQVLMQYRVEGHLEVPDDLPPWEHKEWARIAQDIKNEEDNRIEP